MDKVDECFFCDKKGNFQFHSSIQGYIGECTICGHYGVSLDVIKNIEKAGLQAMANCAHYNFSNQIKTDKKCYPFWCLTEEKTKAFNKKEDKNFQKINVDFDGVSFQAIAFKRVDHSRKPYELLVTIANRLESEKEGAFNAFDFKDEDMVKSKIPDNAELYSVISYLEKQGYIEKSLTCVPTEHDYGAQGIQSTTASALSNASEYVHKDQI